MSAENEGHTDRILLHGLAFYGNHGVSPHEKALGQRFLVDVELECSTRAAGLSDSMVDAVDYVGAYEVVRSVMEGESRDLIESVAEDIAARLIDGFDVSGVRVVIKKPEVAIRGSVLSYVGVEIYRTRGQFSGD